MEKITFIPDNNNLSIKPERVVFETTNGIKIDLGKAPMNVDSYTLGLVKLQQITSQI